MNISTQRFSFSQLTRLVGLILPLLLILCLQATPAAADDSISLSTSLSDSTIAVGDSATLSITVNGAGSANITPPENTQLLLTQRGKRSQSRSINGKYSASFTITYEVQGTEEGTFTIPAFTVQAGGKTLSTEPLSVTITSANQIPSPSGQTNGKQNRSGNSGKNAFLLIEGAPSRVYNGQQIPLTLKAYFIQGLRVDSINPPHLEGEAFVLSPLKNKPTQSTEVINNRQYIVLTWHTTASGIKEGTYPITASLKATILEPQQRMGSRDPFFNDDFFNDFFDNYKRRNVTIGSDPHQLNVVSLPEQGRPADFTGAIGTFAFSVTASPATIEVGDPITLTMTISGQGNFDRVNAPSFPDNGKWKTYTPTSSFTDEGGNFKGKKVFEQAVIADSRAIKELPSLHFSYFDPEKGQYETKNSLPIPLTVKGQAPAQAQTTTTPSIAKQQTATVAPSQTRTVSSPSSAHSAPLHTVRLETGHFVQEISPLYKRLWFIAIAALCSFLLLLLLLRLLIRAWFTRKKSAIDNKKHHKDLIQQSAQLEQYMKAGDSSGFLQASRALIQQLFAPKLKKEATTITAADLQAFIKEDSPLLRLLHAAEQQAYGAMTLSQQEMHNALDIVRTELENHS